VTQGLTDLIEPSECVFPFKVKKSAKRRLRANRNQRRADSAVGRSERRFLSSKRERNARGGRGGESRTEMRRAIEEETPLSDECECIEV
jgi:hypothetical protein